MEKQTENQQEIDKITDNKTITALEEKRMVWEITRIESEVKKLDSEREHLNRPWYYPDKIFRIIMLSIVGAGLFAAWFVGYFQPILNKNQEIAKLNIEELALKNKIQEEKNTIEKNELNKISVLLSEENSKIKNELEALINQNKILENEQKNVAVLADNLRKELEKAKDKYLELSKKLNLTLSERERYVELVKQSNERIISLNQEINRLQEAKEATVSRTNELTEKRDNYVTFGGKTLTFGGKTLNLGGKKNTSGNE